MKPRTFLLLLVLLLAACASRRVVRNIKISYLDNSSCGYGVVSWKAPEAGTQQEVCNADLVFTTSRGDTQPYKMAQMGFSGSDPFPVNSRVLGRKLFIRGWDQRDPWRIEIVDRESPLLYPNPAQHSWARPYIVVLNIKALLNTGYHTTAVPEARERANAGAGKPGYCRRYFPEVHVFPAPPANVDPRFIKRRVSDELPLVAACSCSHANVMALLITDPGKDPRPSFDLKIRTSMLGAASFRVHPRKTDNYSVLDVILPQYRQPGGGV